MQRSFPIHDVANYSKQQSTINQKYVYESKLLF